MTRSKVAVVFFYTEFTMETELLAALCILAIIITFMILCICIYRCAINAYTHESSIYSEVS